MAYLLAAGICSLSAQAQMAPPTAVGSTSSTQTVTLTIVKAGTTSATLGTAITVVTQGAAGLDYAYVSGGTCAVNTAYTAAQTCTVEFSFTPTAPGLRTGAVELFTASGTEPIATAFIYGTGNGPLAVFTPGIITTVAGFTSSFGYSGDGGPATGAKFFNLTGVSLDALGNMYLTDSSNGVIREVSIATGNINTIAGGGQLTGTLMVTYTPGSPCPGTPADTAIDTLGDGCPAYNAGTPVDSAIMFGPFYAALDGAGNLYILQDTTVNSVTYYRIRKVSAATGVITTVAGGGTATFTASSPCPGTSADTATDTIGDGCPAFNTLTPADSSILSSPTGISVDATGNLYISDLTNQRIRKVSATTGIITSVLGNGTAASTGDGGLATSASVYYPVSVTVDVVGNLYVLERNTSNRLREVTASNGIIQTIAGGGTATFTAGSPCPGTPADTATDSAGDGCPAYNSTTADSSILSGASQVVVDAAGNVYISDSGHQRTRKITVSSGIITDVVGNGVSGFAGDAGVATSAELAAPTGIALDALGNLYVADQSNGRVRKISPSNSILSFLQTPAGSASSDSPQTVTVSNNGNVGLVFSPPGTMGTFNPSITTNFTYSNSSTCAQIGSSSNPFILAAGATCSDMISFVPTTEGSLSGSLVSTDNSGGSSTTQTVALSGIGIQPGVLLQLAIANSPSSFGQGSFGDTYTLTPSNNLGNTTTGTLTIVDTLPSGMTATAMSGTGWTCTVSTATCSSTTPIAGLATGNVITLTVSVSANAGSPGVNSATLSSSASGDGASATAMDSTTVTAQQIGYMVNNTSDPGSGSAANCVAGNADTCSLRDAMTGANLTNTATTITFDPNIFPTTGTTPVVITLSSSLPVVNATGNALTLTGPGQSLLTISGNGFTGFSFTSSTDNVSITGLTFSGLGGSAIRSTGTLTATNVTVTGGTGANPIYNSGGTLTLNNVTVSNNIVAVSASGTQTGGAVVNTGTANINNSTITGNSYTLSESGVGLLEGGGITSTGPTLNVTNSTISGNALILHCVTSGAAVAQGGGIFNSGTATITGSTIGSIGAGNSVVSTASNVATSEGGGIFNSAAGVLTITGSYIGTGATSNTLSAAPNGNTHAANVLGAGIAQLNTTVGAFSMSGSTVSGNVATCGNSSEGCLYTASMGYGAGIYSAGGITLNGATAANTIAGNSMTSASSSLANLYGGGIYAGVATVTATDATISGNSAGSGGGLYIAGAGSTALTNVTITGNTASIATTGVGGLTQSSTGTTALNNVTLYSNTGAITGFTASTVATGANNILDGCAATKCPTGSTNITVPTNLGSLANNGGGVLTILPAAGSNVIGAGSNCTTATDERGYPRSTQPCDVGAVRVAASGSVATVTVSFASIAVGTVNAMLTANVAYTGTPIPTGAFTFQVDSGTVTTATCSGSSSPLSCSASYATATLNVGSHTITGVLAADVNFDAATGANTLTVSAIAQTISFTQPATPAYVGSSANLSATGGGSGNPVTFSIISGPATLSGVNNSVITYSGVGTVVIAANQAGNGNFLAATQVTQSVAVVIQSVFIVNSGGNLTTVYDNGMSQSTSVSGGGTGAAVDANGYVWSINTNGSGVSVFTDAGALSISYSGAGIGSATALAIDGNNITWIANGNGTVSALTNAGAAVSSVPINPVNGTAAPASISVDTAGSLWLAIPNTTTPNSSTVIEVIGAAGPISTPTVMQVISSTPGTKP